MAPGHQRRRDSANGHAIADAGNGAAATAAAGPPCDRAPVPENTCGCGELRAPSAFGPFPRCGGWEPPPADQEAGAPAGGWWTGSALFVTREGDGGPAGSSTPRAPVLSWSDAAAPRGPAEVAGELLDEYCGWRFWRFELRVPVTDSEQRVACEVRPGGAPSAGGGAAAGVGGSEGRCSFAVAAADQPWRVGFYSCSGFSNDVPIADHDAKYGGFGLLWDDVAACHERAPLHAVVGTGDQLYCDDLFICPSMVEWLAQPKAQRLLAPFTEQMRVELEAYYFNHYATHWGAQPSILRAYTSIPQIMTWDDHEIFDGWGSYPRELQNCQVFQGIYGVARRFYLLFQQHTTPALSRRDGLFGGRGYSRVALLGPRLAVALPDQRAERTEDQIIPPEVYFELMTRLYQLPPSVSHLIFVTTVPVVYPHLTLSLRALELARRLSKIPCFYRLFDSLGLIRTLFSPFGEPQLLDDLKDHFVSPAHKDERRFLIESMQLLVKGKQWRVSFVSGDVHLCAAGRLFSFPRTGSLARDPKYMPQFVTSPVANAPIKDTFLKVLRLVGHSGFLNRTTKTKMVKMFSDQKHRSSLLNFRNWLLVGAPADVEGDERPAAAAARGGCCASKEPPVPGSLLFEFRVQDQTVPPSLEAVKTYSMAVPPLVEPKTRSVW